MGTCKKTSPDCAADCHHLDMTRLELATCPLCLIGGGLNSLDLRGEPILFVVARRIAKRFIATLLVFGRGHGKGLCREGDTWR
jgi:hypothetical protein